MGIASMVIGILSALVAIYPFCSYFVLIPSIVGLILGIVDVVLKLDKNAPLGMAIAGIALNGFSLVMIIVWTLFVTLPTAEAVNRAAADLTNFNALEILSNISERTRTP